MGISEFKDRHKGESAIVFGTGPTLRRYDGRFNSQCRLIGTNEIIYYKTLMDYYFIGDAGTTERGYLSDPEAYDAYQPRLAKFYRIPDRRARSRYAQIPPDRPGVIYYKARQKKGRFRFYRTIPPIVDAYSISFEAMQFALLSGFTRIYLIGHDCDYSRGSIKAEKVPDWTRRWTLKIQESWRQFEIIHRNYWEHVEIINVNPVGMRRFKVMELD